MKKLNFGSQQERYMCSRGEINQMIMRGRTDFEVIGVTPKGIVIEFIIKK